MGWIKKSRNEDLKNVPESVKRQYRCAFTGHRPEKVIGSEGKIIVELRREIEIAIADGYKVFLTGMSRGVDLWAADIVLELRRYNKDLKLVCVIPFEGMEERWPADWKKHYDQVRRQADFVWVLSDRYSKDAYQKRNLHCAICGTIPYLSPFHSWIRKQLRNCEGGNKLLNCIIPLNHKILFRYS